LNGAGETARKPSTHLIQACAESYIKVLKSFTEKAPDTWEKAERWVLHRMTPMLIKQDVIYLHQITADHLESWRTDWEEDYGIESAFTKQKVTGILSSFFLYGMRKKWLTWNPCTDLEKIKPGKTKPRWFSLDQWKVLLNSAAVVYTTKAGRSLEQAAVTRARVCAFINLSIGCGPRIGDAATMRKDSLRRRSDGKWILHFFAQKPQAWCTVPVEEWLAEELQSLPLEANTHKDFFWTGSGTAETAAKDWHAKLKPVFEHAALTENNEPEHCNPHMFRHSFAVLNLEAGVGLEHVSRAMGHASVKITERVYAHWCKGREDILCENFETSWKRRAHLDSASALYVN